MKSIPFIALLLTTYCVFGQQARIQRHFPKFEDKIDAALFMCDEAERKQGMGVAKIELIDDSTLQIINHTPSPALGGISITLLLDSTLAVKSIIYKEWTDVMGAYKKTFTTESPCVLLSFNPFKRGIDGLQGRYNFILKTVNEPGEMLAEKEKKHLPTTGYFMAGLNVTDFSELIRTHFTSSNFLISFLFISTYFQ